MWKKRCRQCSRSWSGLWVVSALFVQKDYKITRLYTIYSDLQLVPESESKWAASWQNQQSECAPSEDSDQSGHPPSLIRVFAVCMKKAWVLSYPLSAQRRLWSDWADAQADLSLRWAHNHIVGFVTRRLKWMSRKWIQWRWNWSFEWFDPTYWNELFLNFKVSISCYII